MKFYLIRKEVEPTPGLMAVPKHDRGFSSVSGNRKASDQRWKRTCVWSWTYT